jgi:hypothetical protein
VTDVDVGELAVEVPVDAQLHESEDAASRELGDLFAKGHAREQVLRCRIQPSLRHALEPGIRGRADVDAPPLTGMEVESEEDGNAAAGDPEEHLKHRESLGATGGTGSPPAKPVPPYVREKSGMLREMTRGQKHATVET